MGTKAMKISHGAMGLALVGLLTACAQPEVILPGERFGLREALPEVDENGALIAPAQDAAADGENRAEPISLPATVNYSAWTHRAGEADHSIRHPAFSTAPSVIWSARIGDGNDRKHRITADPIVAGGKIFTLDSRATVMAHATNGGTLWSTDLTPASDRSDDASGGGLAFGGGRLFVTNGFGRLTALDPTSGAVIWTQRFDAPASGAPSVVDGIVYVVTEDNRGFAVDAEDGRIKWDVNGTPDGTGVVGTSSPAVSDRLVLFPFSSNEMIAVLRESGVRSWAAFVNGRRAGRGYSAITDITGEPVIAGDVIYAGNAVGRTIAMDMSGQRLWTANDGATGPVWVSGGSVFLISDEAKLVRLDAASGERIWAIDLPYFTKERVRRRKAIYANFGPVLAGGQLWVASSDGVMRGFDPFDGALRASVEIPGGAATRPAVVNGVAYIVTTKGTLLALR